MGCPQESPAALLSFLPFLLVILACHTRRVVACGKRNPLAWRRSACGDCPQLPNHCNGSTGTPPMCNSQCRCAPVLSPVLPTVPMISPV